MYDQGYLSIGKGSSILHVFTIQWLDPLTALTVEEMNGLPFGFIKVKCLTGI